MSFVIQTFTWTKIVDGQAVDVVLDERQFEEYTALGFKPKESKAKGKGKES